MANGANSVPERLINFRVWNENNDLLGIATVELPSFEAMTDTVSGAGIAGEVDSPVLGHFASMSTSFTWRTIEPAAMELAKQKVHQVEVRGAQQTQNATAGKYDVVGIRAVMRIVPKNISLGSFEPAATTDTETEFEVLYIKLFVGGKEVAELDKYNYKAVFGGEDALASVRAALGLN